MSTYKKRYHIVSIVLIITLIITLIPTNIKGVYGETNDLALLFHAETGKMYNETLTVNGRLQSGEPEYNELNDKWEWDSNSKTLTLKGFVNETTKRYGLAIEGEITLVLEEETINTLYGNEVGLYSYQNSLTISGEGTLNTSAGKTYTYGGSGIVIYNGGSISKETNLTVNSGIINATGYSSKSDSFAHCIDVKFGKFTLNGGHVSAIVDFAGENAYGLNTNTQSEINGGVLEVYGNEYYSYYGLIINTDIYKYWNGTSSTDPNMKIDYYTKTSGDGYDTPYNHGSKYVKIDTTAELPKTYSISTSPSSINFGNIKQGYDDQSYKDIEITNTGTGDITSLSAIMASDDSPFELKTSVNNVNIKKDESITISVRPKTGLTPYDTENRTYSDNLRITANNSIEKNISLSARIDINDYRYSVSPSSVCFPNLNAYYKESDMEARTIEFKNTGTDTITGLTTSLSEESAFEVISQISPTSISSGETASFTVRLKKNLAPLYYAGYINILGDYGVSAEVFLMTEVEESTISETLAQINNFDHGGNGTLTANADGKTITVNGEVTNAKNPESLSIVVPPDCTIIWNAKYSATRDDQYLNKENNSLVNIIASDDDYNRRFELTKNGLISMNTSIGGTALNVKKIFADIKGHVNIDDNNSGKNVNAINGDSSGIVVSEGKLTSYGNNSNDILAEGSQIFHLKGVQLKLAGEYFGLEIDTFTPLSTRHGSSEGLRFFVFSNDDMDPLFSFYWNMSGTVPTIVTTYSESDGSETETYSIPWGKKVMVNLSSCTVSKVSDTVWNGNSIKPVPTIKWGGKTLKAGKDYNISYKNNKNIGNATITVKGVGVSSTGTKNITFKILPKKVSIKKLKPEKKKITVTWKKSSSSQKITKYQVQYRIKGKSKWSKSKDISSKSSKLTIKKLKKGKKYQIRIRAYKKVGKEKFYSPWSSIKTSKKVK